MENDLLYQGIFHSLTKEAQGGLLTGASSMLHGLREGFRRGGQKIVQQGGKNVKLPGTISERVSGAGQGMKNVWGQLSDVERRRLMMGGGGALAAGGLGAGYMLGRD